MSILWECIKASTQHIPTEILSLAHPRNESGNHPQQPQIFLRKQGVRTQDIRGEL